MQKSLKNLRKINVFRSPSRSKTSPRCPKTTPRSTQDRPRPPQERPRPPQERPKSAQERPRSLQDHPKTAQDDPRPQQERLKTAQERTKSEKSLQEKSAKRLTEPVRPRTGSALRGRELLRPSQGLLSRFFFEKTFGTLVAHFFARPPKQFQKTHLEKETLRRSEKLPPP